MVVLTAGFGVKRSLFVGSQAGCGVTLECVQRGEMPDTVIDEQTPCCSTSEYGHVKSAFSAYEGEMATRPGVDHRYPRIFSVYGPGNHETSLVALAACAAWTGETAMFSLCVQRWSSLTLADAVRALRLLGEAEALRTDDNPVPNVGSLDTRELRRFVEEILETTGRPASFVHFVPWEIEPEGTPYLAPDIVKLLRNIDQTPGISFRAGMQELLSDTANGEN